jgi:hypothetical protein
MSHGRDIPLLARICGLRGENLSTVVLQELIARSDVFAKAFLHCIREAAAQQGIVLPDAGDAVTATMRELPSRTDAGEKGRLDLAIVTDRVIIGIENKFYAVFQDGQPAKYLASLHAEASRDSQSPKNVILIVIVPETRLTETREHLDAQIREGRFSVPVLVWETVKRELEQCANRADADARHLWDLFAGFLRYELGDLEWVPDALDALRVPLNSKYALNEAQQRLYGMAWRFLRPTWRFQGGSGTRTDSRNGYSGAYCFQSTPDIDGKPTEMWFGFANSHHFAGDPTAPRAHLVLCVSRNIADCVRQPDHADALPRIASASTDFPTSRWVCFELPIDARLAVGRRWEASLKPFIDSVAEKLGPAHGPRIGLRPQPSAAMIGGAGDRITE